MNDLIERQAAIRKLKKMATQAYIDKLNGSAETVINCCIDVIERQIPSAQPERKKGKKIVKTNGMMGYWICDQCNEPLHPDDNFCPNCGADMREEPDAV